jgi:hypothetical protein
MRRLWWLVAAVVLATGCGSGGPVLPVNGIVTMDNAPLADATVTFYPEAGTEATVGFARTGSDGKFVILEAQGRKGLAVGKYKVTVSRMKHAEGSGSSEDPAAVGAVTDADVINDLPAIYSHPSHTVLSYSVTGDGKPIEIKLSSKRRK